jgi:glycosyltransferase involved in cell wall biosynthesis
MKNFYKYCLPFSYCLQHIALISAFFCIFAPNMKLKMAKEDLPGLIFETSWEVCNKVGGIYTVLSTKAKTLQDLSKDNIIFIGPDIWSDENPSPFFKESSTLFRNWRSSAVFPEGMKVRVGRWNIVGSPAVILVDYKSLYKYKNQLYAEMWNRFHVDSLHAYGDYDESCMFAYGAALVIESFCKSGGADLSKGVIAHFDEWTTAMGLLYIKMKMPEFGTVFTTHATCIGRSICGNNKPLYDYLSGYNGDQMSNELNMQSKHSLEKAAAHYSDCFTTVSDVTARECEQLLERRPLVTPNGFEFDFVPAKDKFAAKRKAARAKLLKVANTLLSANLDDDTLIIATSGRNEIRNKGIDVFIDSINALRFKLQSSKKKVLAFIMVPAWVDEPRKDLAMALKSRSNQAKLENRTITHSLHDYSSDAIYSRLNYLGMHNADNENVKIIYVPCYLNGDDGIFNIPYYDLLIGMDCTVFPSYYEPWGYTPLESISFGVPTVTTNLSGFGQWVLANFSGSMEKSGVSVIERNDSNYDYVVEQIVDTLLSTLSADSILRDKLHSSAMKTAKCASWSNFINFYLKAYKAAIDKAKRLGDE